MQGKTAIANILKQEGTDYVFCFPNNALIDAAAAAGIRPIISRMERGAVNMADGYTRVNNGVKNGVCIVQAGPGIENAFPGVAQAHADSVPILMLPGQQGTNRLGMSSEFDATVNYTHDDSNMTVFIAVGPCSFNQFVADQCTFAAEGFFGRPLKVSATGQTAGAYTLVIVNRGPNDEQIAFQVVFTAQAAATTNPQTSRRLTGHGLGAVRLVPAGTPVL